MQILPNPSVAIFAAILAALLTGCTNLSKASGPVERLNTATIAGFNREFREPYGLAFHNGDTFVSDGEAGKIFKVSAGGNVTTFADDLRTPSSIAFDRNGDLVVADTGSHTIKRIDQNGVVSVIAGVPGRSGSDDGSVVSALFNGPIGIAISTDDSIYVADTYNDRIRVIEKGLVRTLAGSSRGQVDGTSLESRFDTPCGIAVMADGRLVVADSGNGRLRIVERDGQTSTLAGSDPGEPRDGLLSTATFFRPTAISVDPFGTIFVADGNAIRMIEWQGFPYVRTISDLRQGFVDGESSASRFNRPSGLAVDDSGNLLVADSDNRVVRILSPGGIGRAASPAELADPSDSAASFRAGQPHRWPFDPPETPREIAGTLGEIRGEIDGSHKPKWFHNGLDVAGAYGEMAYFMRTETVLRPFAVENFGTPRELIRMPGFGYIHIRLGRHVTEKPLDDPRFQFDMSVAGTVNGLRIRRGTVFQSGDRLGTLNSMNHVHLIAGRSGREINAIDALVLPGYSDSREPTIEHLTLFDENWNQIETAGGNERTKLAGRTRIVIGAYDQVDRNSQRRRLGVYRVGYQVLRENGEAVSQPTWTIKFDVMPPNEAVTLVFAAGSRSGATGQTVFNYIASNKVDGGTFGEGFVDLHGLAPGPYLLRGLAGDHAGNVATKDIRIEIIE